jgi:low temperature requirement protein LtrA
MRMRWWGTPVDFSKRANERKVSWLELFYDLGYVAVISQLTHHVAAHPTLQNIGFFFLLFSLVFWSWVNGSQYYDLHGEDNLRTRIWTFWQILAVTAVAVSLNGAFDGAHRGFAITFSCLQLIITYLWWSVGLHDRSHRELNIFYTVNYLMSLGLLIASVFTSYEAAIRLWIFVLLLNLTPPLTGARKIVRVLNNRGQVFSASATLVERFGLFTIIVLAETVLGAVSGITAVKDRQLIVWIAFVLAILVAFLLWSIYFDMTSEQETKPGYHHMQWLIFLHFPLLASFSSAGGCMKVLLSDLTTGPSVAVQWIFCISLAVTLFSIFGLTRIMKEEEEDRSYIRPASAVLLLSGAGLLVLPLLGMHFSAVALLGTAAALLFLPVCVGIAGWVRYKFGD